MDTLIQTQTDVEELVYTPGDQPVMFHVLAGNASDQFASFQVSLEAAGQNIESENDWYSISPEISTKNPSGATTSFQISIIENPIPGFVGFMNLTIRIYSIELKTESREVVKLNVTQGHSALPIDLELPISHFQSDPEIQFDIPILVSNPNQWQTSAFVHCLGLQSEWLVDQKKHLLLLAPGEEKQIVLTYQLPEPVLAPSKVYDFLIEASHSEGVKSSVSGTLEVMPEGTLDFKCDPFIQYIPPKLLGSYQRFEEFMFELQLINNSNIAQDAELTITPSKSLVNHLTLEPNPTPVGIGESVLVELQGQIKRPWLGRMKSVDLKVDLKWSDDHKLTVRHDPSVLSLEIRPVFPWWLAMILIGLGGIIIWLLSPYNMNNDWWGHQDSVTSVQFNGLGDQGISSSNDGTAIRWNMSGLKDWSISPFLSELIKEKPGNKAIRVIRYRPINNDWAAVGLENGLVQIWDLKQPQKEPFQSFSIEEDDRVLDIQFTNDSDYILSSHGSGKVRAWPILLNQNDTSSKTETISTQKQLNFAIYSSAWVDRNQSTLAIAGRFNQIALWTWRNDSDPISLNYPHPGGNNDYIESISTATFRPNRMATADTQGHITLWELENCWEQSTCKSAVILEDWEEGHGGKAIRSVALTDDGCFLASGGDDGRVMLWPLSDDGRLQTKQGIQLFNGNQGILSNLKHSIGSQSLRITSVDIKESNNQIIVISGSTDTQVRLHRTSLESVDKKLASNQCKTLKH